jgi:hypothetical protein
MYKVDNYNRDIVIERYVDDIIGGLHFLEIKERLKNLILKEKHQLSNGELETEIMRHDPLLMTDIYLEEIMKEVEHEQAIS